MLTLPEELISPTHHGWLYFPNTVATISPIPHALLQGDHAIKKWSSLFPSLWIWVSLWYSLPFESVWVCDNVWLSRLWHKKWCPFHSATWCPVPLSRKWRRSWGCHAVRKPKPHGEAMVRCSSPEPGQSLPPARHYLTALHTSPHSTCQPCVCRHMIPGLSCRQPANLAIFPAEVPDPGQQKEDIPAMPAQIPDPQILRAL